MIDDGSLIIHQQASPIYLLTGCSNFDERTHVRVGSQVCAANQRLCVPGMAANKRNARRLPGRNRWNRYRLDSARLVGRAKAQLLPAVSFEKPGQLG